MAHGPNDILDSIAALVLDDGDFPTLSQVASACGLSKPGVLHHFASRSAMAEALVAREVGRVDQLLSTAAAERRAVDTWLELSQPNGADRCLYIAMASVATEGTEGLSAQLTDAMARWESLFERELGDPDLALLVLLVLSRRGHGGWPGLAAARRLHHRGGGTSRGSGQAPVGPSPTRA